MPVRNIFCNLRGLTQQWTHFLLHCAQTDRLRNNLLKTTRCMRREKETKKIISTITRKLLPSVSISGIWKATTVNLKNQLSRLLQKGRGTVCLFRKISLIGRENLCYPQPWVVPNSRNMVQGKWDSQRSPQRKQRVGNWDIHFTSTLRGISTLTFLTNLGL